MGLKNKKLVSLVFMVIIVVGLLIVPSYKSYNKANPHEVLAKVEKVENDFRRFGFVKEGNQRLTVKILNGDYKGEKVIVSNMFQGKLELDYLYKVKDTAIVSLQFVNGKLSGGVAVDYYRITPEIMLFAVFIGILVAFAGYVGLKSIFCFVITLLTIWKVLIPLILKGYNPILVTTITVFFMAAVIIFFIGGLNKKALSAFFGTVLGLISTVVFSVVFGKFFNLNGASSGFTETLLYSGYYNLNLVDIMYSSIILGASGAAMDIAMDIAAALEEIKEHNPNIDIKDFIKSGMNIGKTVIGTMTTTLLLAYSGGFLALLMLFTVKASSTMRILNINYVAEEVLKTLCGSIGLVLVAPFTVWVAAWLMLRNGKIIINKE